MFYHLDFAVASGQGSLLHLSSEVEKQTALTDTVPHKMSKTKIIGLSIIRPLS